MKKTVAVIGAGEVGSRHLQSLAAIASEINIKVVDPSFFSVERAKTRFFEKLNSNESSISFHSSLSELPQTVDLAIIATTADVRRKVVEQLLKEKTVKFLLLEKVLFQTLEDYKDVEHLLKIKNVKAWVNCPLRLNPFFQKLKQKINHCQTVDYFFSGTLFGLACNTIHHLDLLAYFTNETEFAIDCHKLDEQIIESSRKGFIEFTGTLFAETKNGSLLKVTSYKEDKNRPHTYEIHTEDFICFINVKEEKYWLFDKKEEWKRKEGTFRQPLQSELTAKITKEILETGNCSLTTYDNSMRLHMTMLNAFLQFLSKLCHEEVTLCPIT